MLEMHFNTLFRLKKCVKPMKINGNNDETACENLWFPCNGTCKDSALEGTGKGAYTDA